MVYFDVIFQEVYYSLKEKTKEKSVKILVIEHAILCKVDFLLIQANKNKLPVISLGLV